MRSRGFSLVELLVAVMITSIVVIAAYQLMTNTSNGFKGEDSRRMIEANLRNAELLLQRDIARTGYGSGFDSTKGTESSDTCNAYYMKSSSDLNYVAFQHRRVNVNGRNSSFIRIIASFSDYDGFTISGYNRGTGVMMIAPSVSQPLVAGQIYDNQVNNIPLASQVATADTFRSIFSRLFVHTSAIEVTTSNSSTFVLPVRAIDLNSYEITIDASSLNTALCGIDPSQPLIDNTINPIRVIEYGINPSTGHLERCIADVLYEDIDGSHTMNNDQHHCEVLVENALYFDAFPIYGANATDISGSMTRNMGSSTSTSSAMQLGSSYASTAATDPVWPASVDLNQLRGVMYRFGARSSEAVEDSNCGRAATMDLPPKIEIDDRCYLFSHVRGSAIFKTLKSSASTSTSTKP